MEPKLDIIQNDEENHLFQHYNKFQKTNLDRSLDESIRRFTAQQRKTFVQDLPVTKGLFEEIKVFTRANRAPKNVVPGRAGGFSSSAARAKTAKRQAQHQTAPSTQPPSDL